MASYLNQVTLMGNVGADPIFQTTSNGSEMCTFSLATSTFYFDRQSNEWKTNTEWHRIVIFNERILYIARNFRKGSNVYVRGSLRSRKYVDKTNVERTSIDVLAEDIALIQKVENPNSQYNQNGGNGFGGNSFGGNQGGFNNNQGGGFANSQSYSGGNFGGQNNGFGGNNQGFNSNNQSQFAGGNTGFNQNSGFNQGGFNNGSSQSANSFGGFAGSNSGQQSSASQSSGGFGGNNGGFGGNAGFGSSSANSGGFSGAFPDKNKNDSTPAPKAEKEDPTANITDETLPF